MGKMRRVLELRPTQFAVGMLEVDEKIKVAAKFSKAERLAYVKDYVVPVVKGPDQAHYVVDHHHFLCVCYHVGIESVRVKVVKDYSGKKMTHKAFWNRMVKSRNCYPFCQFGEGPRNALYLPKDIRGLADDPYRSLAWYVRKSGAYDNSDQYFAEFQWANFFRQKKLLDREGLSGMPKALLKASRLANSPEAKMLPGFGLFNSKRQNAVEKKSKKEAKVITKLLNKEKK